MIKYLFWGLLLCCASHLSAQQAPPTQTGAVYAFKPLSITGQKRPIAISPASKIGLRTKATVLWIVFGVVMVFVLFKVLQVVKNWPLKILIVLVWLVAGLGVSYIFAAVRFFAQPPGEISESATADHDLYLMTEALGIEGSYNRILPDDNYRLALGINSDRFLLADYQENRGWVIPTIHLDSIIGYAATRDGLPELPTPDDQNWVLETQLAKTAADTLQCLVLHLKGIQPSRIYVRYKMTEGDGTYPTYVAAEPIAKAFMDNILYYRSTEQPQ